VIDDDHTQLFVAMGKCSELIEAHRTPAASGTMDVPDNEELMDDVAALQAFYKCSKDKASEADTRRKALEHPPVS